MADEIKASPQSPGLAALARLLSGTHEFASRPFGYDNPPARMLSEMIGIPATARTVERMSYGEPLTTGRGMTTRMRPDTEEALLAVSPLSQYVARVPRAAQYAVTQAAKDFAHASTAAVPHVIKPKGGNWLSGSVENALEPMRTYLPSAEMVREAGMNPDIPARHSAEAMNKWIDTKLAKYIKNEMGTPEDPIRALAERGVTHSEVSPLNTYDLKLLGQRRESVGFPAEGLGKSEQARAWEAAADEAMHNLPAGHRLEAEGLGSSVVDENPWLQKVPPETMTYGTYPMEFDGVTQFGHMIDELRNAVNPESGLPANLRWKYTDLDKVTVSQAVQRVHDINQWRAEQKVIADQARANNAAAFLHKDYPDAPYKWVELKAPTDLPEGWTTTTDRFGKEQWVTPEGRLQEVNRDPRHLSLEDALKYEGETMGHCVGGYCPDVLEGRSRIFSLRNKKTGEPHVTVEVKPEARVMGNKFSDVFDEAMRHVNEDEYAALEAEYGDDLFEGLKERYGRYIDNPTETIPDIIGTFGEEASARYAQHLKDNPLGLSIEQIKGKANRAPKEEYLPYVQDFVRSGTWGRVGDFQNTGLKSLSKMKDDLHPELFKRAESEYGQYLTDEELKNLLSPKPAEGFAHGGLVGHTEYDPMQVDMIVDDLRGYAEGGEVDLPKLEFEDPESLRLYKHAMKLGFGPSEVNVFGTGVNAGNLSLGLDTARVNPESSDRLMNSLMANYGVKLGDVGLNANLRKPLDAEGVYLGMLNGSIPVGEGMAMLGVQGVKTPYGKEVTGYNAGWSGKVGSGRLNVNVMQPKGNPSNRSTQVQYQVPFAEGGSVKIAHIPYDEAKISSLVNALREELHA